MIAREESRDERGLTIEERSVARSCPQPGRPAAAPTRATVLLFLHTFNEGVRRWRWKAEAKLSMPLSDSRVQFECIAC